MNILWIINIPLPEASVLMNEKPTPFGGWLVSAVTGLIASGGIDVSVAFPQKGLQDVLVLKGEKITFYAFPPVHEKKVRANQHNIYLEQILDTASPDIVHVFGTEYAHTLDMVNTCRTKNINVLISIQGLISICAKHYVDCLPESVLNRFTFRDFIKQDNIKQQQQKFDKRGSYEIEALQKVKHIIGRTTWDRACTFQINSDAQYHFCNETLRDEFYKHTWDINKCEKNSIFISQGSYPIKGLHFMLEAMPLILKRFPNTKLYVGGQDLLKSDTLMDRIKVSSYGKYLKELIRKYSLVNNVVFTGLLDEKQMCNQYLKAHVFVCSSTIENSPNSLGEAMILGVPSVAAYVGGIPDMITHSKEGYLYQPNAIYMLSHYICEIFEDDEKARNISKLARTRALKTHNRDENISRLIEIYNDVIV